MRDEDQLVGREYTLGGVSMERDLNHGFKGKGPKGWIRSDQKVKELICEALYVNSRVDASNIEVEFENGIAILTGNVKTRDMKKQAEECIEHIEGIFDIRNELIIES